MLNTISHVGFFCLIDCFYHFWQVWIKSEFAKSDQLCHVTNLFMSHHICFCKIGALEEILWIRILLLMKHTRLIYIYTYTIGFLSHNIFNQNFTYKEFIQNNFPHFVHCQSTLDFKFFSWCEQKIQKGRTFWIRSTSPCGMATFRVLTLVSQIKFPNDTHHTRLLDTHDDILPSSYHSSTTQFFYLFFLVPGFQILNNNKIEFSTSPGYFQ